MSGGRGDQRGDHGVPGGPGLTRYTGYLLRRAYVRSVDRQRECPHPHDAGLRETALLAALDHEGPRLSQRELGELLHVNRTVMVKLVDALEARGWVARERKAGDRRSYLLRLTEAGAAALKECRRELEQLDRVVTADLSAAERRRLTKHLRALLGVSPVLEIRGLGDLTAFLLAQAHRTMRDRATEAFDSLGIDPRDFGILSVVAAEQPCSRVRVAARIGVTPPAVQSSIDSLVERGLLRLETNAEDRRVHALALTDKGQECLDDARRSAAEIQAEITGLLGESAEAELRTLLTKLIG